MRRAALVLGMAASACSFDHGALPGDAAGQRDAPIDTSRSTCFGGSLVHVCVATPTVPVMIMGADTAIDTDATVACAPLATGSTTDACVLVGTTVAVAQGSKLTAHGMRPLVIVASSTAVIDGTIDVASHRGGNIGPNADPAACVLGTAPTSGNSGGGGYGGSHGGKGGNGAGGDGGAGGIAAAAITDVTTLRGGCPGSDGATTNAGAGGHGGGAVYLIATSITINGIINASGAGGTGATGNDSGGGGGGAGGMIGLEAPSVVAAAGAKIFANGGGGGEGYEQTNGHPGDDSAAPTPAAPGGAGGSSNGGDGGNGSQATAGANGKPGNSSGGGSGGGGGGAGVIVVVPAQTLGGSVMPAPR